LFDYNTDYNQTNQANPEQAYKVLMNSVSSYARLIQKYPLLNAVSLRFS